MSSYDESLATRLSIVGVFAGSFVMACLAIIGAFTVAGWLL